MEVPHEEIVGDLSHIVKGKRTKRLRPQSPIPFTITSHSSTRIDGHDDQDGDVLVHGEVTIINDNNNNNDSSTPSPPATSADNFLPDDVITEEEEETAKCLILLSQGGQPYRHSPDKSFKLFNDDMGLPIQSKFNSKKYIETTNIANGGGKVGTYVYECKTCNRTFSSFQALGGHRASHKKPKPLSLEPKKPFYYFSDQDEPSPTTTTTTTYKNNNNNNNNVKLSPLSPLSFQFNNINMESPTNKSSPRIHTCSYCGAEFNSGQALGGHMRRHRGGANTNLCLSPLSSITPTISLDEFGYNNNNNFKKPKINNNNNNNIGLSLDLNLPAPEDQSHQSRNLQQEDQEQQKQQQQHEDQSTALVLSTTPQLIDCHY